MIFLTALGGAVLAGVAGFLVGEHGNTGAGAFGLGVLVSFGLGAVWAVFGALAGIGELVF